ncbi:MAG: hypothetical protein WCR20_01440 [Verrucomicrobiota bacterium]
MQLRKQKCRAQKKDYAFVGVWIPTELLQIIDSVVESEDTDRSKFIRRALDFKLRATPAKQTP